MIPTIFGFSTAQNGYLVHTPLPPHIMGVLFRHMACIELASALGAMCEILTGMDAWHVFTNNRIDMVLEEPSWKSNI